MLAWPNPSKGVKISRSMPTFWDSGCPEAAFPPIPAGSAHGVAGTWLQPGGCGTFWRILSGYATRTSLPGPTATSPDLRPVPSRCAVENGGHSQAGADVVSVDQGSRWKMRLIIDNDIN